MNVLRIILIVSVIFYFNLSKGNAQAPLIQLQESHIIYKQVDYKLLSGKYVPPFTVNFIDKSSAKYDNPINSAIAMLSAMKNKDYQWWIQIWSDKSRVSVEQAGSPDNWVSRWSILNDRTLEIRYRADYQSNNKTYALIGYAIKGLLLGDREFESVLAFKKEGTRWYAARELASDPVFNNILRLWNSGELILRIN